MTLAIHMTHIELLRDEADLMAYLFERDLKWYHKALSLQGRNRGQTCDDLIRRINASRAIGVPPLDLYEAIDEALGTFTLGWLKNVWSINSDVKAFTPEPEKVQSTVKVIKKGEEKPKVFVVRETKKKIDYAKVERLASTWQTDTQLARYLDMDRKTLIKTMLNDVQFRIAVERGRAGRSRGDNAHT